ncbi:hypothetical protein [Paludibacterium yongneupense]|uniref:hypothetical protein n=1 Tax=Paludibacterium yongneupense TaxID=400061 RepID=UPI00040EBE72|nr:hypothetical protein [Paludibacterium yongneupense]
MLKNAVLRCMHAARCQRQWLAGYCRGGGCPPWGRRLGWLLLALYVSGTAYRSGMERALERPEAMTRCPRSATAEPCRAVRGQNMAPTDDDSLSMAEREAIDRWVISYASEVSRP